jgi:hypothetical protein
MCACSFSNSTVGVPEPLVLTWLVKWSDTREPSGPLRTIVVVLCAT